MKTKLCLSKILALAVSLMMALSVMYVPVSADVTSNIFWGTDAAKQFSNAKLQTGSADYTLEDFKADVVAANYGISQNFESVKDGTYYSNKAFTGEISTIKQTDGTEMTLMYQLENMGYNGYELKNNTDLDGKLSSGDGGIKLRYGFTLNWDGVNSKLVNKQDRSIVYPDFKPIAVAWSFYSDAAKTIDVYITYDSGVVDSYKSISLEAEGVYFFGYKAPSGNSITQVAVNASDGFNLVLDDLSFLFEEFKTPASIVIEGASAEVSEPQYNASKAIQLSAKALDANNEEMQTTLTWSATGNGATIDQTGLLTLKRTLDTSIAGDVKVTVTAPGGVSQEATIKVNETAAYYGNVGSYSITDYTTAEFSADLATATHKAVINREDGAESYFTVANGNLSAKLAQTISNTDETTNPVKKQSTAQLNLTANGTTSKKIDYDTGDVTDAISLITLSRDITSNQNNNGYYNFEFDETVWGIEESGLKLTSIGMAIRKRGGNDTTVKFKVFLDGDTNSIEYIGAIDWVANEDKDAFFGYEAPEGRYIKNIEFDTESYLYLDDIGMIFEKTQLSGNVFSTDAAQDNVITSIADAAGAGQIHVAFPADASATGTLILAAYDNNGLIGVNFADESTGRVAVTIPEGKNIAKIKMFVWDNMTNLKPLDGRLVVIDQ